MEETKRKTAGETFRRESNQVYVQGAYAPVKNFEIFGRLGGADLKLKAHELDFKDKGAHSARSA